MIDFISSLVTHLYFGLGKKNIDYNFFIAALGKRKHGMESPLLSSAEPDHMDESSSFEGRSVSSEHSAGFLDPFHGLASHMNQECAFCHSKSGTLKRCLGCKKVFYCGKACQKEHWKKHKTECRGNRKLWGGVPVFSVQSTKTITNNYTAKELFYCHHLKRKHFLQEWTSLS